MPISEFSYVPKQSIIDTYVPLPFKEMQEATQRKQLERDTIENKLSELPKHLQADIEQQYFDSKDNGYVNPNFQKYQKDVTQFSEQINEAAKKLQSGDLKDAKIAAANIAGSIADWKNKFAIQAENETKNYRDIKKKIQEDKDLGKDTFRSFAYDASIRNQRNRDLSTGYKPTNFSSNIALQDNYKEVADIAKSIPLNEKERKSFRDALTSGGYSAIQNIETSKGSNAEKIKQAVQPVIERATSYFEAELIDDLANNPNIRKKAIEEGYNPDKPEDIIFLSKNLKTGSNSNYYNDFISQKQKELLSGALGFEKTKDLYKTDLDLNPEWLQKEEGNIKDPLSQERATYLSDANLTGQVPIDFTSVSNIKDTSPDSYLVNILGYSSKVDPDGPVNATSSGTYNPSRMWVNKEGAKVPEEQVRNITESFKNLKRKAEGGDLASQHEFFYKTNPIYKNTADAYTNYLQENSKNSKRPVTLTKDDYKNIQNIANNNIHTVSANQSYDLNKDQDNVITETVAKNILNNNAKIYDKQGNLVDFKDLKTKSDKGDTENLIQELKAGVTGFITPVGSRKAGFEVNIGGEKYKVDYSNPVAYKEFERYNNMSANIYDASTPPVVKINPPVTLQNNVSKILFSNNINSENVRNITYNSIRDDYDTNNSKIQAVVELTDGSTKTITIPYFGNNGVTVSKLAGSVNPVTGQIQDMSNYNIKNTTKFDLKKSQ